MYSYSVTKKLESSLINVTFFQIANPLVWDVEGEEVGMMVLVDVNLKELGEVLMRVELKDKEDEAGVVQVENPVETEVNHSLLHFKMQVLHVYRLFFCWFLSLKFIMKDVPAIMLLFSPG